jgi:LPXTG-motif cell wall-anchored protein
MQADGLLLRDIHQPPSPPWWPPAPGWWLLIAGVALLIAGWCWLRWRRRRHAQVFARLFDEAMTRASTPGARIAAMSELLRRAARRVDPDADTLVGDDWLRFLDTGLPSPHFTSDAGRALSDGIYRREVSEQDADALQALARARFLSWMSTS